MDTVALDKAGLSALKPDLDKIEALKNMQDLLAEAADLKNKGINIMFSDGVGQDDKNSEMMAYRLDQGGLGMPNRDYYFNTDARTATVREAYHAYLFKTFKQLGNDSASAQKNANTVYNLESRLAKSSRKLADLRDPYKNYNKMDLATLNKLTANIDWFSFTKNTGINKIDSVIVGQPEFYTTLSNEIKSTPLDDWKQYFRFHLIQSYAGFLDKTSFDNAFEFRKSLSGAN